MAIESQSLEPQVSTPYRYRWHSAAFLGSMFALAILALIAIIASSRTSSTPLLDERTMSAAREQASIHEPARVLLARAGEVQLMLPINENQITAIGYQPVADSNVVSLNANGHQLNDSIFSSLSHAIGADGPGYFVMGDEGSTGPPTASLDVGAPYGSVVFSPVDGTVAGIRTYNLKGRCPDTEVKIQPLNESDLMVVMTHVGSVQATLGQPLKAGSSKVGSVRKLDSCMDQQLGRYTYDSGNHLHLQVERVNSPQLQR